MPKFVLKDAVVTVNSVDLSDHFSSVEISSEADDVDFTAFGAGWKEFGQGLKDATITCETFQDFDASKVDATVWPLYLSGGTFPVTVKPTSASPSGSNPIYSMTARVFTYNPLAGDVGDASTTELTFRNGGTAGLTRGTA